MNYIYDAALAVILILCVFTGYKKGLAKIIVSFVAHVLCIVMAFVFSVLTAEGLYMSYIKEPILIEIEDAVNEFDITNEIKTYYSEKTVGLDISDNQIDKILSDSENMDKSLADSFGDSSVECNANEGYNALYEMLNSGLQERVTKYIPSCAGKYFDEIKTSREDVFGLIQKLDTDKKAAASYIEEKCVRVLMIKFVKIVAFVIFSIVFMIIAKIILTIISKNQAVQAAGKTDAVLGSLIGFAAALIIIIMLAFLVKMIIYAGGQNEYLNEDIINNSLVFKYFYKIDNFLIK